MKLIYFNLNYYSGFDFQGFPVGKPVETHLLSIPESAVETHDVVLGKGISNWNADTWARNLGYQGRFGIEQVL